MFCWHKWSKWQEYQRTINVQVERQYAFYRVGNGANDDFVKTVQYWESRTCAKCGQTQRQRVC